MKEYIVQVYSLRTDWFNKKRQYHREDGPAIEWNNGAKEWFQNGKRYRVDGPAVEWPDGTKFWYQHGKLHREDGPAVEYANGTKEWIQNGKLHREDGPAVELANGHKEWWITGVKLTEEESPERTQQVQEMTMEQVCRALGKTIKIVK